jgi:hypothetical protein
MLAAEAASQVSTFLRRRQDVRAETRPKNDATSRRRRAFEMAEPERAPIGASTNAEIGLTVEEHMKTILTSIAAGSLLGAFRCGVAATALYRHRPRHLGRRCST